MGLDIIALSHVKYVKNNEKHDPANCENDDHFHVGNSELQSTGLKPGCYVETKATKDAGIRLRYSSFLWWRDQLCRFALGVSSPTVWANRDEYKDKPFVELIGCPDDHHDFGPAGCAVLARDFAEHEERAREFATTKIVPNMYVPDADLSRKVLSPMFQDAGEQWIAKYLEFKEAFGLGAQDGLVMFR